jgi:hypothetical protein
MGKPKSPRNRTKANVDIDKMIDFLWSLQSSDGSTSTRTARRSVFQRAKGGLNESDIEGVLEVRYQGLLPSYNAHIQQADISICIYRAGQTIHLRTLSTVLLFETLAHPHVLVQMDICLMHVPPPSFLPSNHSPLFIVGCTSPPAVPANLAQN